MTLNQIEQQSGGGVFTFRSNSSGKTFDSVRREGNKMLVRQTGTGEFFLLKTDKDGYNTVAARAAVNPRIAELQTQIAVMKVDVDNLQDAKTEAEGNLEIATDELETAENDLIELEEELADLQG